MQRVHVETVRRLFAICLTIACVSAWTVVGSESAAQAELSRAEATAILYIRAMAAGDRVKVGQLDFACQFRMVGTTTKGTTIFPHKSDSIYDECWKPIAEANAEAAYQTDEGLNGIWPGEGTLVFFGEDFKRFHYAASAFASELAAAQSNGAGIRIYPVKTERMPPTSFRLQPETDMVGAPASLIHLRVGYKDPLTSPIGYPPGTYTWTTPVKRPRQALKAVTLQLVVLSDLEKLGFPGNYAVVNLPVIPATATHPSVPFLTKHSGYVLDSGQWWGPEDSPDRLVAAVGHAAQLPTLHDRVPLLNRVLIIDPEQTDALNALTRDLYAAILADSADEYQRGIGDKALADRFAQFYWDNYAQGERLDISLDMEMGGFAKPTTADSLFRMIPAMEKLAELRPEDLENRFRLGIAYRWNLDQLVAIDTHAALVDALPIERPALRARALTELAWSKIAKVAYTRRLDDVVIREAYAEAQEAYDLSTSPIDKFTAAYTAAYSLVFTPDRDNEAILNHLTEAMRWYLQVDGASAESWQVLLGNDTIKPVIDADPALRPVSTASAQG